MKYVAFDIETTGLDKTKDHIIQFAAIKFDSKLVDEISLYICPEGDYTISPQAYIKHNINAKTLEGAPTFKEVANRIIDFFETPETVSFITYNGNSFDIPFIVEKFKQIGIDFSFVDYNCYDVFLEEKERNGINLEKTYKRYKGIDMESAGLTAHDALSDVKATYSIFVAQQRLQKYGPTKMFGDDNVITIMDFRGTKEPCFNVGKYKQLSVEFVKAYDRGYLEWAISDKCGFSDKTKNYIRNVLNN